MSQQVWRNRTATA